MYILHRCSKVVGHHLHWSIYIAPFIPLFYLTYAFLTHTLHLHPKLYEESPTFRRNILAEAQFSLVLASVLSVARERVIGFVDPLSQEGSHSPFANPGEFRYGIFYAVYLMEHYFACRSKASCRFPRYHRLGLIPRRSGLDHQCIQVPQSTKVAALPGYESRNSLFL